MNAIVLLVTALLIFIFGYRFYAKLVVLTAFHARDNSSGNYSTPTNKSAGADYPDFANKHSLLSQYLTTNGAFTALFGTVLAVAWGWAPVFLWIIIGSVISGGVYAMGVLWLGQRYPKSDFTWLGAGILSPFARTALLWFVLCLMLFMNALLALVGAALITTYPAAALPFWLQLLIAYGLTRFLYRRLKAGIVPALALAFVLIVITVWLGTKLPFTIQGKLTLDFADHSLVLDATVAWLLVILLVYFNIARTSHTQITQPLSLLLTVEIGILIIVVFAGIMMGHPTLSAPNFNHSQQSPALWPTLFVILSGGTMAGIYNIASANNIASKLPRELNIRYVGYGSVLIEAGLALSALIACTANLGNDSAWIRHYSSAANLNNLPKMLSLYLGGVAHFSQEIGIDRQLAQIFTVVTLSHVCMSTLESGLRFQRSLFRELRASTFISKGKDNSDPNKIGILLPIEAMLGIFLYSIFFQQGRGLWLWALTGSANLIFTSIVLLLISVTLRRLGRPIIFTAVPLLGLLVVANTWLGAQLLSAWRQGNGWQGGLVGLAFIIFEAWIAIEGVQALRKSRPTAQ